MSLFHCLTCKAEFDRTRMMPKNVANEVCPNCGSMNWETTNSNAWCEYMGHDMQYSTSGLDGYCKRDNCDHYYSYG